MNNYAEIQRKKFEPLIGSNYKNLGMCKKKNKRMDETKD